MLKKFFNEKLHRIELSGDQQLHRHSNPCLHGLITELKTMMMMMMKDIIKVFFLHSTEGESTEFGLGDSKSSLCTGYTKSHKTILESMKTNLGNIHIYISNM